MKQLFTLGFVLIISTMVKAQVYKFTAFQTSSTMDLNKTISEKDWENTDMVVEINLDKNLISIFGEKGNLWNLLTKQESFVDVSSRYVLHYNAVDRDGVKCQAYITFFKDSLSEKIATLTMIYSNYKLSLRLKKTA